MLLALGVFCIIIALLMLLLINLFSQAFPSNVLVGDEEVLRNFFTMDNLIYPIATIIIGLIFLIYHFTRRKN
ncbi:hypothetical protein ABS315_16700 [Peribacillus frigoritolerans]|uniref:Uncharacterized protein n=1 Tax=Peribacillus simplex TaxID=1478 RepID=A0A9W4KRU2_9BACI|nr:hypothetical protein [Peribacillus simplex]MDR4928183.1 hypothetical protein [Peribacillus simplex]CAH0133961.1 hypothetical protein SRABI133_00304 [Peribacillus simplex]